MHDIIDGYCYIVYFLSFCLLESLLIYSQLVTLQANIQNNAQTVLDLFLAGVKLYSWSSHICRDCGGKNKLVFVIIIIVQGEDHATFIWGL